MKKITPKTLMMMCLLSTYIGSSQTLNQPASWPNTNWTLSGTFAAVGVLGDPTIDATFGFDDDAAGNGSINDIKATSPVIDLTAASTAGEIWLTINSDFVYREFGGDVLNIEIYDADAMTWTAVQTFAGNSTNTDYQTCNTTAYITPVINISAYTATQLSGFQYRITYDDVGGYQWGFCITSPTIVSGAPCSVPDTLFATTITETSADFGWTENGTASSWNIELVDVTAGGTFTGTPTASGVTTIPYNQTGLVADNAYRFFVQADCGVNGTSMWVGPFRFSSQYIPVAPDCTNGIFLDSGGITGTYGFSETITYTICPTTSGDNVEVEFTVFSTENNGTAACFDGLTIHDGADATATTVDPPGGGTIWCHDTDTAEGTGDLLGQTITSTDASGCLTFVFTSDDTVQLDGWEAIVNCSTLSTISFDNGRAFTYFPNPVDTKLTLLAGKKIENVTIYTILGAQVLTTSPNALTKDIDTSKLTTGTYFVQVTVDGVSDTIKIIKQ